MSNERQVGWRELERSSDSIKKAEVLKIPLDQINVKPGFNPRASSKADTRNKILAIKDSYKAGRYVPPIECSLENGTVYIVDGHGRFEAAVMAHEEMVAEGGMGIASLVVVPFRGNDADRLVLTITANEGEKLIPIECAEVVKRLMNLGWDKAKIAETFSWSPDWVNKLIYMIKFPEKLKQMIFDGKISTDVATATFKKHGENAVEVLEGATEGEDKKLTSKKIREVKPMEKDERFLNRVLDQVKVAVVDLGLKKDAYPMGIDPEEDYEIVLKGATLKALVELQDTMEKRERKESE